MKRKPPGSIRCVRTPVPWLVKERDLRRYLGRALAACARGRVILVSHRFGDGPMLFAIARESDWEQRVSAAFASFRQGRFRRIVLEKMPPINPTALRRTKRRRTKSIHRIPKAVASAGRELFTSRRALAQWLNTPAPWTQGKTPWELLQRGGESEVLAAMKGLLYGNFL